VSIDIDKKRSAMFSKFSSVGVFLIFVLGFTAQVASADPTSDLRAAIKSGNLVQVRQILHDHQNLEFVTSGKAVSYALYSKIYVGDLMYNIVHALLLNGAQVTRQDNKFMSMLTGPIYRMPSSLRVRLAGLLKFFGAPEDFPSYWIFNDSPAFSFDDCVIYFSAISFAERPQLREQFRAILDGLMAVRRGQPAPNRDVRQKITKMLIAPLVDEHMTYVRQLIDNARGRAVSFNNAHSTQVVLPLIDSTVNNPKFWTSVRERAEINIIRALFNDPRNQAPWSGNSNALNEEHQHIINDFVQAYTKLQKERREEQNMRGLEELFRRTGVSIHDILK
jgi:hypothetical protein